MSIERGDGDLLRAKVDALVNPVNTVGVMGKGLALQFKKAFPDCVRPYEDACSKETLTVGTVLVVQRTSAPRFIVHFPTKKHWKQPSKLSYIEEGLPALIEQVRTLRIESIALPPLGCGLGGLAWGDVKPLIERAFAELPSVRVLLFEPNE